jgi:asparagine synthase (glutamine-hydrolysing)
VSDVPYGVFLSGGIDSSIVAAYAQSERPQPINSFSIGFKEAQYNESQYAKKVANHIGMNHHEFTVSYDDAIALTETYIDVYDEPYADASGIPTMLVSELARKHVTMVLTGDGGDEQFLGYGMYKWAKRLDFFKSKLLRNITQKILNSIPDNRSKRVAQMFDYEENEHIPSHIFSVEQYLFSKKDLTFAIKPKYSKQLFFSNDYYSRNLSSTEKQSLFDIENYLNGDLLVKVDRASMYHSLEARSPLLDYRIVEFSINLDESLKLNGDISKYILKELLYEKVPREMFDRPKWGFGLPIRIWLKNEMREISEKYLSSEMIEKYGIFNDSYVRNLWIKYLAGEDYLFNKIWSIICLNLWLSKNEAYFTKSND